MRQRCFLQKFVIIWTTINVQLASSHHFICRKKPMYSRSKYVIAILAFFYYPESRQVIIKKIAGIWFRWGSIPPDYGLGLHSWCTRPLYLSHYTQSIISFNAPPTLLILFVSLNIDAISLVSFSKFTWKHVTSGLIYVNATLIGAVVETEFEYLL